MFARCERGALDDEVRIVKVTSQSEMCQAEVVLSSQESFDIFENTSAALASTPWSQDARLAPLSENEIEAMVSTAEGISATDPRAGHVVRKRPSAKLMSDGDGGGGYGGDGGGDDGDETHDNKRSKSSPHKLHYSRVYHAERIRHMKDGANADDAKAKAREAAKLACLDFQGS